MEYDEYFSRRKVASRLGRINDGAKQIYPGALDDIIEELEPGSRILDFGCGLGDITVRLAQKYPDLQFYGYDVISYERESHGAIENLLFLGCSIGEMPRFDLIVSLHVFEHVDGDFLTQTIQELYSRLVEKGRLFVAVPNAQSPTGCYWRYEDFTHRRLFTVGSLKYLLMASPWKTIKLVDHMNNRDCAGLFSVVRIAYFHTYRTFLTIHHRLLGTRFHGSEVPSFGYEIKIICQK